MRYDRYGYNRYSNRDDYFSADEKKIKRDFMNYADPKTKKINEVGYEKMGKTLGIDIYTDIFMTYFSYKCGQKSIEYITEEEYSKGLKNLRCNTLEELKKKILKVREDLLNVHTDDFLNFFYFLFDFNVPGDSEVEKKKKTLSYDIVEVYFKALFCNQFKFVGEFLQFLKAKNVGLKWDEWRVFLDLIRNLGATFPKDYNIAGHYCLIYDEFYRSYCTNHKIKIVDPYADEEEDD